MIALQAGKQAKDRVAVFRPFFKNKAGLFLVIALK
jgi:hypothetical protein